MLLRLLLLSSLPLPLFVFEMRINFIIFHSKYTRFSSRLKLYVFLRNQATSERERGMDMKFDTLFSFERKSSFSIRNRYRFRNRQISSACLQCAEHSNTGECSLLNQMPFIEKYLNGNRTQLSLQFICYSVEHLPKCFSLENYLSKLFARLFVA